MELIGFFLALLVGGVLGLMGGGGSILALPILVYIFSVEPILARTYSLFIIGSGAFFGLIQYMRRKDVDYRIGLAFILPASLSIYLVSTYLLPIIPQTLFYIGELRIGKNLMIMLLFSILMLLSSYNMIKGKEDRNTEEGETKRITFFGMMPIGFGVGVITELLGAGGGFIIVPVLVFFAHLSIHRAIGTSLFIITMNSMVGIFFHINTDPVDWEFIGIFSAISLLGVLMGTALSKKIEGQKLKKSFGYFVLLMAVIIITKELVKL